MDWQDRRDIAQAKRDEQRLALNNAEMAILAVMDHLQRSYSPYRREFGDSEVLDGLIARRMVEPYKYSTDVYRITEFGREALYREAPRRE